ncbi:3',5'-cyclic-nucleotide phosphodiesterase [Haematococcus lacustris]|uniref:3',5'-cyclic-nucleotide phosphodiesterase n=1 Tax=Haematococcus lacustris TaxID=44745 RepID=A0A699ZQT0_HAELA|nr:3',5'-cyclic-nucleotide phosphodiesterase [Haematococcus lacustris]
MKRMDSCRSQAGLQPVSEQDKLLSLQVGVPSMPLQLSYPCPCCHTSHWLHWVQMALKCADMGHLAASESVHLAWVSRLEGEFFAQGDAERAQGLPISPLCDRTKQGVTKSQVGFFEFVALPMFNNFTARFTGTKPLLQGVLKGSRSLTGNADCIMGAKQFMA